MNTLTHKDFTILFKKLLVTLALYLIPVLTACAILMILKNFQEKPVSTNPPAEQIEVVDN